MLVSLTNFIEHFKVHLVSTVVVTFGSLFNGSFFDGGLQRQLLFSGGLSSLKNLYWRFSTEDFFTKDSLVFGSR